MTEGSAQLIVLTEPPFASNALREGLDVALVAAAFGQPVTLLFTGEGALALLKAQTAGAPGQKAVLPTIEMLKMYDIEQLWVDADSLRTLGLENEHLVEAARVISCEAVAALYREATRILHF